MKEEPTLEQLSKREKQIAQQVIAGKPNKVIAYELFISERTVKFHCANIYRKLGIHSRYELFALWYKGMPGEDGYGEPA